MAVFATCERHGMILGQCSQCWDEERTRLEHRLAEVTKERDEATQIADACCEPAMEGLVRAEARLDTLETALKKYGKHLFDCDCLIPGTVRPSGKCTCGLLTALESA